MTITFIIAAVVLSALIIWILFFKKSTDEKDTKIDNPAPKDFRVSKTSVKKTFTVPVGSVSKEKAKESLTKLISDYKEVADTAVPRVEVKAKKKWPKRKKKVAVSLDKGVPEELLKNHDVDIVDELEKTLSAELGKPVVVEANKPKKKRGRKPKNKGGDKDQLILS